MSAFEEELGQIDWESLLFSENLETVHRIFIEELKNVRNKYTKLVGNKSRNKNYHGLMNRYGCLLKSLILL